VLVVALWALVPARPVFAQVTSTSAPAVTTTTNAIVTTTTSTSTTTTTTTMTSTTTTLAPDFPIAEPFNPDPPDVTTGPPVTGVTIPVTVTTEVTLPFSRPFSTSTSTTADAAPTTADSSTTVLTTTTTTTALTESLRVVAEPAPVPSSPEERTGSRPWIVLAGAGLVLLAALGARRLKG
jgi:hypothetical protein